MDRVNAILHNEKYKKYLNKISLYEVDRKFCKHNIEHFLDVGRIAYIMVLEKKLKYSKEIIYSIALLHDIGRWKQYEEGISHEKASAELAKNILKDVDFNDSEIEIILKAILKHRKEQKAEKDELCNLIYMSDKLSRKCFSCSASSECNWKESMKNLNIKY
ncbi:HD domain-containing protein [Haloimpatiens sp. FM7330]|uniref:HD domain-containing protein n=1 Tax=Haloimpatiens sp. FM7330 TaxID=3298610 RepID=UPI0036432D6D